MLHTDFENRGLFPRISNLKNNIEFFGMSRGVDFVTHFELLSGAECFAHNLRKEEERLETQGSKVCQSKRKLAE